MKKVGSQAPDSEEVNIAIWECEFLKDGTLKFGGRMKGPFDGMEMKGSGTWTLINGTINYTAGNNKGTFIAKVAANTLILSPDVVIALDGGKRQVTTEYMREPK